MNTNDLRYNILLNTTYHDLKNMCMSDKLSQQICNNLHFWRNYFSVNYNIDIILNNINEYHYLYKIITHIKNYKNVKIYIHNYKLHDEYPLTDNLDVTAINNLINKYPNIKYRKIYFILPIINDINIILNTFKNICNILQIKFSITNISLNQNFLEYNIFNVLI